MSEPGRDATDAAPEPVALQARIAALRPVAARVDPVRLRYLEALAARLAVQDEPVRVLLCEKLAAAVAECERRCAAPPAGLRKEGGAAACSPLVELNRTIHATASRGQAPGLAVSDELPSARRFRRAWLGIRTQEQVQQAVARKPAKAGPLNSHALVVESLAMMSRLSPDYLRRFVAHVQALQWLEQAGAEDAPSAKAAPRGTRASPRAARRK